MNYADSGVDVKAGYEAVELIKEHARSTSRPGVLGGLGGFGGLFSLGGFNYEEPVLVSGADGVGTKLKLAFMLDKHDTVGIDCVAMCVNDIVCSGAEPLFFLDYLACGKNNPAKIAGIVSGVAEGCRQAGCALIGGETAEMPGFYSEDEYDLAGFAVGAAERRDIIDGSSVREGDTLIGLHSSGVHSNGFSLIRKLLTGDELRRYGEELLTPTRIYVKPVLELLKQVKAGGICHITGGGFYENLPRMLPDGLGAEVEPGWPVPPIFNMLSTQYNLGAVNMYGTFNMGIGMVIAVRPETAALALEALSGAGAPASVIGRVVKADCTNEPRVRIC